VQEWIHTPAPVAAQHRVYAGEAGRWGYSDAEWTPILIHLSGLFVEVSPKAIDGNGFLINDKKEREGPIYEFPYLVGSIPNRKLTGTWITPPASPTNAALFVAPSPQVFVDCIRQRTLQILGPELGGSSGLPAEL
jgi:hypothetical protein